MLAFSVTSDSIYHSFLPGIPNFSLPFLAPLSSSLPYFLSGALYHTYPVTLPFEYLPSHYKFKASKIKHVIRVTKQLSWGSSGAVTLGGDADGWVLNRFGTQRQFHYSKAKRSVRGPRCRTGPAADGDTYGSRNAERDDSWVGGGSTMRTSWRWYAAVNGMIFKLVWVDAWSPLNG